MIIYRAQDNNSSWHFLIACYMTTLFRSLCQLIYLLLFHPKVAQLRPWGGGHRDLPEFQWRQRGRRTLAPKASGPGVCCLPRGLTASKLEEKERRDEGKPGELPSRKPALSSSSSFFHPKCFICKPNRLFTGAPRQLII